MNVRAALCSTMRAAGGAENGRSRDVGAVGRSVALAPLVFRVVPATRAGEEPWGE